MALALAAFGIAPFGLSAAWADPTLGAELANATIQDAQKQPAQIPSFGEKVLLILYTDPDVADQNDPFEDQVKAQNFDKGFFTSVGIANMQDAPAKPNWIIRAIVRSKIKKYNVTILTDPDLSLAKQWNLGDCNNKSVVMLFGKDKKLKYFKKGALSPAEITSTVELIRKTIVEAGGPATGAPSP
jgi:predicted transcriptional regulator